MKHHYTVERELAVPRYRLSAVVAGKREYVRAGELVGSRFIVELDPELLVERLGARALRARRGTVLLHGGGVKVIALRTSRRLKDPEAPELELA